MNDRIGDRCGNCKIPMLHARGDAASAIAAPAKVRFVRSPIVDPSCSEKAVWNWLNLTPLNDRNREVFCDAINSVPRLRGVSASAIAV